MKRGPIPMPAELRSALKSMGSTQTYLKGSALFSKGQLPRGVYLVETGEVYLFLCSDTNAGSMFEKAGPGALLGLSEAVSGENHKLRAEAACSTKVSFVCREDLLAFLRRNQACCMQIVRLLSEDLHLLYHRFRSAEGSPRQRKRAGPAGASRKTMLS